ncbi:MAG: sulfite reductase subunit beta [Omnitrophica bacterium RIFCSPHIGHO2_02_FULL_46_11]|nr:MAG: sulfite reductase subunit beta [Omnitrophica bacterium RIFCSPLOWO2_01_FULL_45_10b]OGW87604.1 MAG: sulfite reductase subunit beta [Omnitrophica bacterium RIFCSPHIGHO2_02_FULL_46_11]
MANDSRPELERVKEDSRYLRGTIKEELAAGTTHFLKDNTHLLKAHGTYQQDDRDIRNKRRKEGLEPLYTMMIRSKIPGGRLTPEQYLIHDELADLYGDHTLRITTRQGFQFHSVFKKNLKAVIRGINEKLGTTLGACGDNVRNVLGCPAPSGDRMKLRIYEYAKAISDQFLAKTRAYHEIWINGEKLADPKKEENEPIYGKAYLPRKFKIAMAFPEDNCVDVYTNDIGIVPEIKKGELTGFNILVGGGLGMSHGAKDTFPRLADPLCFVSPNEILDMTKAIVLVQRDYGDRKSRKHARMKYLIHDRGLPWFQAEVEKRFGKKINPPHVISWKGFEDHLGWHEEGNGLWYFGISVENGRIKDEGSLRLKSGLHAVVERFKTNVYLTATQDILISDVKNQEKAELENLLASYGIPLPNQLSMIQKNSMSCPALPTCGLAITESERSMPALVDQLESALNKLGLGSTKMTLRMTGCPNGCARPYSSEIGLVGRAVGTYNIYLGGNLDGTRLNQVYFENVREANIVNQLIPIFKYYKLEHKGDEEFGNFCHRIGVEKLSKIVNNRSSS